MSARSGGNREVTRGMTEDRMIDRLEGWTRRGGTVEMVQISPNGYGTGQQSFYAYVLRNESGEPARYIFRGPEAGDGYLAMGRSRFGEFLDGPERTAYNRNPPILSFGRPQADYSVIPPAYPVDPASMRERFDQRRQAAAAPPPPSPPPEAQAQSSVTSAPPMRAAFSAAASGANLSPVAPAASVTTPVASLVASPSATTAEPPAAESSLPQYVSTNSFVADMMRDGARVVKLGRNEGDIMVAVGRDGRAIAGIDPDSSDPSKSTVFRGADLTERLAQDGLTTGDFERFAQSLTPATARPSVTVPTSGFAATM